MSDGLRMHPYQARPVAGTHTWLTPEWMLFALGAFDLDPCAAPSPRPWPTAHCHIELPDDGLQAEWRGRVWCNPPFGSQTCTGFPAWLTIGTGRRCASRGRTQAGSMTSYGVGQRRCCSFAGGLAPFLAHLGIAAMYRAAVDEG